MSVLFCLIQEEETTLLLEKIEERVYNSQLVEMVKLEQSGYQHY